MKWRSVELRGRPAELQTQMVRARELSNGEQLVEPVRGLSRPDVPPFARICKPFPNRRPRLGTNCGEAGQPTPFYRGRLCSASIRLGLLSRGSQVRVLPGAPTHKTSELAAPGRLWVMPRFACGSSRASASPAGRATRLWSIPDTWVDSSFRLRLRRYADDGARAARRVRSRTASPSQALARGSIPRQAHATLRQDPR